MSPQNMMVMMSQMSAGMQANMNSVPASRITSDESATPQQMPAMNMMQMPGIPAGGNMARPSPGMVDHPAMAAPTDMTAVARLASTPPADEAAAPQRMATQGVAAPDMSAMMAQMPGGGRMETAPDMNAMMAMMPGGGGMPSEAMVQAMMAQMPGN